MSSPRRRTDPEPLNQLVGALATVPTATGDIPNPVENLARAPTHEEIARRAYLYGMPPFESLGARIRGEYGEMPGLRLTFAQACRLAVDARTCETLLEQLVRDEFLHKTDNGAYVALARPRPRARAHRAGRVQL